MSFAKIKFLTAAFALVFSVSAFAADGEFYTAEKLRGHEKGEFVVLDSDDVNLRAAPENGRILTVLSRHALLQVLEKDGQWYKVHTDGIDGYVYAPFTSEGLRDALTEEDFALGYAALNSRFDEDEASAQLGKAIKVTKRDGRLYYEYQHLTIGVRRRGQNIEFLEIRDPQLITMRGVSIGDGGARVVGQYGVPDGVIYKDGKSRYEYFFKDEHKDDYYFYVDLDKQGKVAAIVLEKER